MYYRALWIYFSPGSDTGSFPWYILLDTATALYVTIQCIKYRVQYLNQWDIFNREY